MQHIIDLGYHTAYQLCSKGYHITMICRDYEKARKATNDIVLALVIQPFIASFISLLYNLWNRHQSNIYMKLYRVIGYNDLIS